MNFQPIQSVVRKVKLLFLSVICSFYVVNCKLMLLLPSPSGPSVSSN